MKILLFNSSLAVLLVSAVVNIVSLQSATFASKKSNSDTPSLETRVMLLFNRLQKKIGPLHTNGTLPDIDVKLHHHPLSYPLNHKTPSLNHFRLLNKTDGAITQGMINNFIDRSLLGEYGFGFRWYLRLWYTTCFCKFSQYKNMVENILMQEIKHRNEYYAFYHACSGKLILLHDVLTLFNRWGLLDSHHPLSLRFLNRNNHTQNIQELITKLCSLTTISDHTPEVRKQLLSVNLALFGNHKNDGESTWNFFVRNASNVYIHNEFLREIFNDMAQHLQVPEFFIQKFMLIMERYATATTHGSLLQFFVKKDTVDNAAFCSEACARLIRKKIFDTYWDDEHNVHTAISPFLEMYQNDPQKLTASYALNNLQARLYLPSLAFLDQNHMKVLRYGFTLDSHEHRNFLIEINSVIEDLVKYIMQQILTGKITLSQVTATPFGPLAKKILKLTTTRWGQSPKMTKKVISRAAYLAPLYNARRWLKQNR